MYAEQHPLMPVGKTAPHRFVFRRNIASSGAIVVDFGMPEQNVRTRTEMRTEYDVGSGSMVA